MWDITLLKETNDGKFIVMTPNGDVHCIDKECFSIFEKGGRVNYDPTTINY